MALKLIPWYRRVTAHTVFQSVVLGVVGGPVIWGLMGCTGSIWWCCLMMAVAPLLVDVIRPTYVRTE